MCTLCLREEKKRKKKKPTCHFFWFKFYSRMEGRILGPKHSARLEIQGTKGTTESSSLLPMESQLGGGVKEKKNNKTKTEQNPKLHWCPCPVSTICGSSVTHFPRPFSYSTRKPWLLPSPGPQLWLQVLLVSSRQLVCLPIKEFLCTGFCFPG